MLFGVNLPSSQTCNRRAVQTQYYIVRVASRHSQNDLRVTSTVDQRLLSCVLWPEILVVKLSGVPHNFVHHLWKFHRVS